MSKRLLRGILVALVLLLALAGGYFIGQKVNHSNPLRRSVTAMDKLKATLQLIQENYVDSVDINQMVDSLIPKLVGQLDPHTTYLTAEERRNELESLDGFFYGVGITFNTILDTAIVVQTIPNGPSDIAGLRAGDRIVEIDGEDVAGKGISADSIRMRLKGKEGSIVHLGIRPYNTTEVSKVQVKRGVVTTSNIDGSYMVNDSLGYLHINGFSTTTHNDFMQAVARLRNQGAEGLVIDLRGNSGGLVQTSLLVANELLPRGSLIIYTEGAHEKRSEIYSDGTGTLIGFPTFILIDEASASAAEIVSGALQDNDVAIIIGRRSFGKGLVQKPFEFYDGSSVHLTIARYYTASGRSIQREYKLGNAQDYVRSYIERVLMDDGGGTDTVMYNPELTFKTLNGRTVYGGGGIMPDVYVAHEDHNLSAYAQEVIIKGLLGEFAFVYADRYRDLLTRIGSAEEVCQFLQHQGLVWQLSKYAQPKGVVPRSYQIAQSQQYLNNLLFYLIINNLFGNDASASIKGKSDPMIIRASQLFDQKIHSPLALPEEIKTIPDSLLIAP